MIGDRRIPELAGQPALAQSVSLKSQRETLSQKSKVGGWKEGLVVTNTGSSSDPLVFLNFALHRMMMEVSIQRTLDYNNYNTSIINMQ